MRWIQKLFGDKSGKPLTHCIDCSAPLVEEKCNTITCKGKFKHIKCPSCGSPKKRKIEVIQIGEFSFTCGICKNTWQD